MQRCSLRCCLFRWPGVRRRLPSRRRHRRPRRRTTPATRSAAAACAPRINSFTAEPRTIERGQSATLRWSVANAPIFRIDQGLGAVQANGNRQVFPSNTTTYTLTAQQRGRQRYAIGDRGSERAAAAASAAASAGDRISGVGHARRATRRTPISITTRADIRDDAGQALTRDADLLKRIFAADPQFHGGARRPLRRARLGRIQPGSGRSPRHGCQGISGAARRAGRQDVDHQLRQGSSGVHGRDRGMLSAQSPRASGAGEVASVL